MMKNTIFVMIAIMVLLAATAAGSPVVSAWAAAANGK